MKDRRIAIVATVVFISVLSGGWLVQHPTVRTPEVYQKSRLFDQILGYIAEFYVDSLSESDLYEMAIEGMLDRVNDPYTSYLRREAYEELSLSTTGNYGGVGIRIESRDSWITVVAPLADTPGERAGLSSGDQIVEIEGKSTKGWTTQQAADVMRGEPGTVVHLTVVRAGLAEPLEFDITRARIHVNYVEGQMSVAPGIGYVRLTSVSQTASDELRRAIDELRAGGVRSLILDLRGNPGGILEQGVAIADLFLDRGQEVVEMRGRAPGSSDTLDATRPQRWPDMPVVVLVNEGTASAAEILAGALQDHDRALVLGTRTFGKGVAYRVFPLSETEAVSVTVSRWYTPNGRSIDRPLVRSGFTLAHAALDSAGADTTVYLSDSGRHLKGGGGIRPDIEYPDTLTEPEQAFAQALGSDLPKYRDAMARYALDLKGAGTVTNEGFTVGTGMLNELLDRLRKRGVDMPDSIWAGARDFLAEQFGFEVARYVFGRPAELRRRVRSDHQVSEAIQLLQKADSQEDLLALTAGN